MIATCIYCGHQVQHGSRHSATQQEAHKALIEHDRQCPKNPIAQELAVERERGDALAAHVELLHREGDALAYGLHPSDRDDWDGLKADAPESSLARLKAQWQAEMLEVAKSKVIEDPHGDPIAKLEYMAYRMRRQAEGGEH
ncbi:hypothetical protein HLV40_15405 [Chromohalobacter salexigens]|nr:hypothetical protein [Chromohalobacter salexigens]